MGGATSFSSLLSIHHHQTTDKGQVLKEKDSSRKLGSVLLFRNSFDPSRAYHLCPDFDNIFRHQKDSGPQFTSNGDSQASIIEGIVFGDTAGDQAIVDDSRFDSVQDVQKEDPGA
jgi:hypothetical protein